MKVNIANRKSQLKPKDQQDRLLKFLNNLKNKKNVTYSRGSTPRISYRQSFKAESPYSRSIKPKNKIKMKSTPNSLQKQNIQSHKTLKKNIMPQNYFNLSHEPIHPRSLYLFIYQIGFGGFGKVWKVQDKNTKQNYAMKQICKQKVIQKESVESILNERRILSKLDNPFIVNMSQAFQDKKNLYLVIDYLKGADLRYHICYKEIFSQNQTKFIIACLIQAVQYIHKNQIIHRDIKPENLILQQNGYLRLTDFGIAKYERDVMLGSYDSSGTPGYMAPQILFKKPYTYSADYFAIGVIAYQLMLGKRPYIGKNRKQIKELLSQNQTKISDAQIPYGWSQSSKNFINSLIQKDPLKRLGCKNGIHQLKKHSWLKDIDWRKLFRKQIKPPFVPYIVCETKDYLDQINSYNELNEQQEGQIPPKNMNTETNKSFSEYCYSKKKKQIRRRQYKKNVVKPSVRNSYARFL